MTAPPDAPLSLFDRHFARLWRNHRGLQRGPRLAYELYAADLLAYRCQKRWYWLPCDHDAALWDCILWGVLSDLLVLRWPAEKAMLRADRHLARHLGEKSWEKALQATGRDGPRWEDTQHECG